MKVENGGTTVLIDRQSITFEWANLTLTSTMLPSSKPMAYPPSRLRMLLRIPDAHSCSKMPHSEWEDIDHELGVPFEGSVVSDGDTVDPLGLGGTPECVDYMPNKPPVITSV
jgi:hypothetical protein